MNFGAPLTSVNRTDYSEAPNVRGLSSRDPRLVSRQWGKAKRESTQNFSTNRTLAKVQQDLGRLKHRVIGGGTGLQFFLLVSDGGDWYNCYSFDGTNIGDSIIKVAKHQELMCILPTASPAGGASAQKIIRGVTYTYTYTPTAGVTDDGVNVVEYTRGVTGSDSSAETDYVTPCLNAGQPTASPVIPADIISALPASFSAPETLLDVQWQALADGRAWAAPKT